ncbi:hypothetical protein [Labilibacter marinus]|uniref:hypothetical protein n=1 Tax=Labilibacter marinus TaxID=1477105 RepID=UPI0008363C91|nr:hypothetical protein [Labilibacter marinus]
MSQLLEIKKQLSAKVVEILDEKIDTLNTQLSSAKESRDSDTKSSVGDKYETSRAMMHIEIAKNEAQLSNFLKLKNQVSKINVSQANSEVGFGTVVITNKGNYFVSVAIGKLSIEAGEFYSISMVSPIGKKMAGLKAGDKFTFQEQTIVIKDIV